MQPAASLRHFPRLSKARRVLSNNQYAIAERKPLAGEIGDGGIERGVPDGDAGRCSNDPQGMLVRPVP
jgi:hypothetical protein